MESYLNTYQRPKTQPTIRCDHNERNDGRHPKTAMMMLCRAGL